MSEGKEAFTDAADLVDNNIPDKVRGEVYLASPACNSKKKVQKNCRCGHNANLTALRTNSLREFGP